MRTFLLIVASAGGLGYAPVAPGTFGTLAGVPFFWAFHLLQAWSVAACLGAFVLLVAAACWIAGRAEEILRQHDSGKIVIDEVAGYVAATLFLDPSWHIILLAFVLFRALDIFKPFPASLIDRRLPGGYGVVLDDVVSGLYANLALRLLLSWM